MNKAVEIIVSGVVQGVGFRWFAMRKGRKLGIVGFVKNQPDGTVYILAEGEEYLLREFIDKVKIGPSFSHVSAVNLNWKEPSGRFNDFDVHL